MRRKSFLITSLLIIMLIAVATTGLTLSRLHSAHASSSDKDEQDWVKSQRVAVPSYFSPGSLWTQIEDGAPTVGLAVINPGSGPGRSRSESYAEQVDSTKAEGVAVIGYISTSYAGTHNRQRSLAAVKRDIDTYYRWYPNISGFFIDEVTNNCAYLASYYKPLYDYIKHRGGLVVLNPGTNSNECYMSAGNIIVNFEGTASQYAPWTPASWVTKYNADRFWHIIYNASQDDMHNSIELSKKRHVDWVYVTNDSGNNPYDSLPFYWNDELSLAQV